MGSHHAVRYRAAATGLVVGVLAAGCGGSDEAIGSSNRGAGSHTEDTTVENAFIVPRFVPGSCAVQIGDAGALTFSVTNNRITESEQLLGIESPAADAFRLGPSATLEIPPETSIAAGQPVEDLGPTDGVDEPFTVTVEGLRESARPGTSVDVTFRFEKRGDLAMKVPIEACPTQN